MRSLCLLVLMASLTWEGYVHGRSIHVTDSDEQNIFGHLYLLDSSTGHSQRLKRRHVVSPQEDVQRLRLDLSSLNKVIDIDLQDGSVWDSTTDALLRHGEHAEPILLAAGPKCHFSGRVSTGHGYASFSFCNGVNGIIHTNNESYVIQHVTHGTDNGTLIDTDADLPSLAVKITRSDDVQSSPMADTDAVEIEDLLDVNGDDYENYEPKTTELPRVETTTTVGDTTTSKKGGRKATIEVGIYINANYTGILKGMKISTTSQIVDWVINRWNIIRQVYGNKSHIGADIDIKIKRLEIWTQNPAYYDASKGNEIIKAHLKAFCGQSPKDGVDHKMMYTWEHERIIVGCAYTGGICLPIYKCSLVIPQRNGIQRELHELGHSLGLRHDTDMRNCSWPVGFMGFNGDVTEFKNCYRPVLLSSLAHHYSECLYSFSNLTGQVSFRSDDKLVPANQSLSSILDKW